MKIFDKKDFALLINIRKLILILICVGVIVFFNACIDSYFRSQVNKIFNQVKLSVKDQGTAYSEINSIQSDMYRVMHETSVKADVYGNFLVVILLMMAPFLLLEKKKKD